MVEAKPLSGAPSFMIDGSTPVSMNMIALHSSIFPYLNNKFELFLFDYFTHIEDLRLLRIDREQEFAPVKNPTGIDSVVTAREMYMKVHKEEQE